MTEQDFLAAADWPPLPFLCEPLRGQVEQQVSAASGRVWAVRAVRDLADLASHPCALLSDGSLSVFVKFNAAVDGLAEFEAEQAGLRLLAEQGGARTPAVIGLLESQAGAVLVLEAIPAVDRGPRQWRQIGQALARLHQATAASFGLDRPNYFGPFVQDNRPLADWPTFYAERRLLPYLKLAVDAGHLPPATRRNVERLLARLPALCGPPVPPALLHGDAHQSNFISAANGAVLVDPAVYYGHPEADLALLGYFQPVPDEVLAGYAEVRPIEAGFAERRDLWRVAAWLAVVAASAGYLGQLNAAVRRYV